MKKLKLGVVGQQRPQSSKIGLQGSNVKVKVAKKIQLLNSNV
jgi:hypothetical protein